MTDAELFELFDFQPTAESMRGVVEKIRAEARDECQTAVRRVSMRYMSNLFALSLFREAVDAIVALTPKEK